MKQITTSKILTIQIVLNVILTIFIFKQVDIFFFVFQEVILTLTIFLKKRNTFLSIVFLPFIFMYTYSLLLYTIVQKFPILAIPVYIVYVVGILLILIPVIISKYVKVKDGLIRLLSTIWLIGIIPYLVGIVPIVSKKQSKLLFTINSSGILYAIIAIICIYILFDKWGYSFYFNFKVKNVGVGYYLILFLALLFITWYAFFHTFLGLAESSKEIFYKWNFSLVNPTYSAKYSNGIDIVLNSLEPAIYEEIQRYAYIFILLIVFKMRKNQLQFSVLISASIFSLSHVSNFLNSGLPFENTMSQIIVSFGLGCFLAFLFLYTGKIWLNILVHFGIDFLTFSITDIGYLTMSVFNKNHGWVLKSVIELCLLLVVTFVFMRFSMPTLKVNAKKFIK